MRFGRPISISKDLTFPVRKSVVRDNFQEFDKLSCHFGSLGVHFRFDSRCFDHPKLDGPVIASLSSSRAGTSIMQLYPIRSDVYLERARSQFEGMVIPYLKNWLLGQLGKPDTAILGYEQIIVTWNGVMHSFLKVKYL
jgi:hypothetical protein